MSIRNWAIVVGSALGIAFLAGLAWFMMITMNLPSAKELANYEPPIMSRVHAGDGKLVAEFATQHRVYVPSEELPDQLIQAFISAEDKTFFEHSGVNLWGMFRGTVLNAVRGRRMTGGSTITQQVVKNMLVGNERSLDRKVREAILAGRLEKQFTKHQILELYMNEIYLGGPSWGVGAASLNYFGKSLSELSLAECALLAALPQQPARVNPYNHPEAAIERRNWVIDRMAINGYIEKADAEKAKGEPLTTVARLDTDENQAAAYYVEELRRDILRLGKENKLEGMADQKAATKAFYEGGLSIRSTLDSNLQLIAQTALRAGLETYDRAHGWRGPVGNLKTNGNFEEDLLAFAKSEAGKTKAAGSGNNWQLALVRSIQKDVNLGLADGSKAILHADDVKWASTFKRDKKSGIQAGDVLLVSREPTPNNLSQLISDYATPKKYPADAPWRLRQVPAVEGALVAMDAHTGRVYAMAGGYSFKKSQYNRATQAMRQPGSSFKPFVYAAALENGWTPSSRVLDAPYVSCDPHQDTCYKPSNYEEDYVGLATLRFGVVKSRNAMTVRLASDLGLPKVSEIGERFGMYDKLPPYEAMALGAGETTPIRMARAYASLVNGGKEVQPMLLDRIQNRYGQTIYRTDERVCTECQREWQDGLQPPAFPDERKQLMDPVTAYQMVSILEGVVQRGTAATELSKVGKPLAAKTGTTNDQVDAWMVGFTPDMVVAVWVGFDKPKPMGQGATGGRLAAPIFRDFMLGALKDKPVPSFRIPTGVRLVETDMYTGCLPGAATSIVILEAFKPGTEPTERCEGGLSAEGYKIDFNAVGDGDEFTRATDAPAQPGQEPAIASTDPNAPAQPVDPNAPVDPNKPKDTLTLGEGVF